VVRWSVFLLGPAGCGKTAIWRTLMKAQNNAGEKTVGCCWVGFILVGCKMAAVQQADFCLLPLVAELLACSNRAQGGLTSSGSSSNGWCWSPAAGSGKRSP
jgi:hypothetical protein